MRLQIVHGTLLTPDQRLFDYALTIEAGRIAAITPSPDRDSDARIIDARDMWVVPGFIDLHVHGAQGHDTMHATPEALHGMARFFARHGVTSYLPTTLSAGFQETLAAVQNVAATPQPTDGAHHLGVHLEGPYLNPAHAGAQRVDVLRDPDPAEYEAWFETGVVRLMTLAPERARSDALIAYAIERGVQLAIGHSGASYAEVVAAASAGVRQATHTFNGMLGLHHRRPGTLGGVLTDDRIFAQVICDWVHVHPAMIDLLVRAKGIRRTILITDAMQATGLEDGTYDLGGQTVTVRDGIARIAAGNLAGSTLTMDAALRKMMAATGLSLQEALPMATSVPAMALQLGGRKGVLAVGADADVVVLDQDLSVRLTIVAGQVVHDTLSVTSSALWPPSTL